MTRVPLVLLCAIALLAPSVSGQDTRQGRVGATGAAPYVPPRGSWQTREPARAGMDAAKLAAAVAYAQTRDSPWGRDDYMADQVRTFGRPL
ncbi:MAG: serine hydrolase, partial [Alphaproteobacteria bacterium]